VALYEHLADIDDFFRIQGHSRCLNGTEHITFEHPIRVKSGELRSLSVECGIDFLRGDR
jgi:hypothetical protein